MVGMKVESGRRKRIQFYYSGLVFSGYNLTPAPTPASIFGAGLALLVIISFHHFVRSLSIVYLSLLAFSLTFHLIFPIGFE